MLSIQDAHKGDAPEDPTKNYERPSVPIPALIAEGLTEHIKTRPTTQDAFILHIDRRSSDSPFDFYERRYSPAVKIAEGVPDNTRFHDLRHTYAALLIAA